MYLISILILMMGNAFAGNISVSGVRQYSLSFDKNKIQITSPVINLEFSRKSCNERIFESFLKKTALLEKDKKLQTGFKPAHFNFSVNGGEFHESLSSSKAKFIDSLPEELQRMKIEEGLRCKTDQSLKKDKKS